MPDNRDRHRRFQPLRTAFSAESRFRPSSGRLPPGDAPFRPRLLGSVIESDQNNSIRMRSGFRQGALDFTRPAIRCGHGGQYRLAGTEVTRRECAGDWDEPTKRAARQRRRIKLVDIVHRRSGSYAAVSFAGIQAPRPPPPPAIQDSKEGFQQRTREGFDEPCQMSGLT